MRRIQLTNSAQWFDRDTAKMFDEKTWWNGNNYISSATGSQWHHEAIYMTKGKKWVLCTWSNYEKVATTYTEIEPEEAFEWLLKNGHDEAVPQEFLTTNEL